MGPQTPVAGPNIPGTCIEKCPFHQGQTPTSRLAWVFDAGVRGVPTLTNCASETLTANAATYRTARSILLLHHLSPRASTNEVHLLMHSKH